MWARLCLAIALALAATGTAPLPATAETVQAAARIEVVTVRTAAGEHAFKAEIADTPRLRERGLMFRHRLPDDRAMLFDWGEVRSVSMWMRNTRMPLDMLFIAETGRIVRIAENTVPLSPDLIVSGEPIRAVLEIAGGSAARLGIKSGDMVQHGLFEGP